MTADDLAYSLITEYQELSSPEQLEEFEVKHYDEIRNFVIAHSNLVEIAIRRTTCKNGQKGYKTVLFHKDKGVINNRVAYASRATALMSIFYAVWQKDKLI